MEDTHLNQIQINTISSGNRNATDPCGSMRQEEFTSLSPDLVPGRSVEEMLTRFLTGGGFYSLISTISHIGNTNGGTYDIRENTSGLRMTHDSNTWMASHIQRLTYAGLVPGEIEGLGPGSDL
ncbi:hypothetical protein CRENBAI_007958 [Crenichthys baileyi]|uniref:Uncharacterized protein n=1 Tax=Crenichthys baileyi TaxID=28760 RepID=A0AAV9SN26_9TELE